MPVHIHHRRVFPRLQGLASRRSAPPAGRGYTVRLRKLDRISTSIPARCRPISTARSSSPTTRQTTSTSALRALHRQLRRASDNITTGRIYQTSSPRARGDYLGATIQVIPHVTTPSRISSATAMTIATSC